MRMVLSVLIAVMAHGVQADTLFATKTLRARHVLTAEDVLLKSETIAGAASDPESVIGAELLRSVYAGRPILLDNLAQPTLVDRNEVVRAVFTLNGLTIETEARALQRGRLGDVINAMNLTSRKSIRAEVLANGELKVLP
ncbi:flagellar basal body P-ring formation chaperone FlgA [Marivita hallyeonensis]|uniref:Flagella basal body P-ring formation protein FlgA n=1 Tax=Marivita hallyeonensis TaxID=996342 RepID=A0A1M5UMD2_9RHOB|nr:flagellar basal body P-ring formation chaperone FlgA [Marivita hallyeonensis]SHH64164.1 flagella basal body P-ring formation protein FlgA [Marivita hallyeonensis]